MNVANTIDLSASVSQYLQTNAGSELTLAKMAPPKEPQDNNDIVSTTPSSSATSTSATTSSSFYPQAANASTSAASKTQIDDAIVKPMNFEFFTRSVNETIDEQLKTLSEGVSTVINEDTNTSETSQLSPMPRRSIYECSDSDDESDNNSSSRSRGYRGRNHGTSGSSDDNDDSQSGTVSTSKDKDMRISSILFDNDYSNGDIDLRLPFKPVMANYIPATEIDASITSHPPIVYKVIMKKIF